MQGYVMLRRLHYALSPINKYLVAILLSIIKEPNTSQISQYFFYNKYSKFSKYIVETKQSIYKDKAVNYNARHELI